ncbi:MAG: hypothetical protein Phyf2KO_17080 [Phycisphaerales bacterium]
MILNRTIPVLLTAATCAAQSPREPVMRVLVDTDLESRIVDVFGIDQSGVTIIDETGVQRFIPLDTVVALAPIGDWHDASNDPTLMTRGGMTSRSGLITLTDGQQLVGMPSVISIDEEFVAWSSSTLGIVGIPIENIRRITMPRLMPTGEITPPLAYELDDVIRLANGDTLRGFIETVGAETTIETNAGALLDVDTANIDQITLANDPAELSGTAFWLADGSVICMQSYETDHSGDEPVALSMLEPEHIGAALDERTPSEADAQPFGLTLSTPLREIVAVTFDSRRVIALSVLEHASEFREIHIEQNGIPALGSRDITMPGPMRTTWVLPQSATRLAFNATLPIDARAWGNLDLIVRVDEKIIETRAINAESPSAAINIAVSGNELVSLEIDEAEYGPIQDKLVISEAIVLIGD